MFIIKFLKINEGKSESDGLHDNSIQQFDNMMGDFNIF